MLRCNPSSCAVGSIGRGPSPLESCVQVLQPNRLQTYMRHLDRSVLRTKLLSPPNLQQADPKTVMTIWKIRPKKEVRGLGVCWLFANYFGTCILGSPGLVLSSQLGRNTLKPGLSELRSEYPNSRVLGPKIHTLSGFWTLKPYYLGTLDPLGKGV